jgi:tetratricopeptide (TPR) repeat protein
MATKRYFSPKPPKRLRWIRYAVALGAAAAALYALSGFWGTEREGGEEVAAANHATLDQARERLSAGDTAGARELLAASGKTGDSGAADPRALLIQAEIELQDGKPEAAIAALEQALAAHAHGPDRPELAVRLARVLDTQGRHDEAVALYEEVERTAPPGLRAGARIGLARKAERAGDRFAARAAYREAMADAEFDSELWNEAVDAVGRLNVALIFSPEETPESRHYTVEPGDNLTGIGIKLNTTQGLLFTANNINDATQLRVGQRLKYTPKDFRVVVERSKCRLFLLDKDGLFKRYRVGLGKPGYETALGKYTVGNKQKDPTWFRPGGSPVPPNDPENELGTRWMPLVPVEPGLPTDLGIHGTVAPETIGHYASRGCPRLVKEDVEELFDLIVRSTAVEIVETVRPEDLAPLVAETPQNA